MVEKTETRIITVKKKSGSDATASVSENGRATKAVAPTLEQALADAEVKLQKE